MAQHTQDCLDRAADRPGSVRDQRSSPASPDTSAIVAAVYGINAAISSRDIGRMASIWAQEPYAMLATPRDKTPAYGWDAVKKGWETAFAFWSDFKVSRAGEVQVHATPSVGCRPVAQRWPARPGSAGSPSGRWPSGAHRAATACRRVNTSAKSRTIDRSRVAPADPRRTQQLRCRR